MNNNDKHRKLIGLVPAAGEASRISPLPCSKELLPIGFMKSAHDTEPRPKVASQYLLEKMRTAGASSACIVLRKGKWDIPAYFGSGALVNMNLSYMLMQWPYGVPYTLFQALPFVRDATVLFGFPDILFSVKNPYQPLLEKMQQAQVDITLGLFVADNPQKMDMVALDNAGNVCDIVIKPKRTDWKYTWIIAAWSPRFTAFLSQYVEKQLESIQRIQSSKPAPVTPPERYLGDVIKAYLQENHAVATVLFKGDYIDIGTGDDLKKAVQHYAATALKSGPTDPG